MFVICIFTTHYFVFLICCDTVPHCRRKNFIFQWNFPMEMLQIKYFRYLTNVVLLWGWLKNILQNMIFSYLLNVKPNAFVTERNFRVLGVICQIICSEYIFYSCNIQVSCLNYCTYISIYCYTCCPLLDISLSVYLVGGLPLVAPHALPNSISLSVWFSQRP